MYMDRDAIFERLRTHMAETLEMDEAEITEDLVLVEDLDADSLDLLEFILVLQEEFGVNVSDGEVKELLTELAQFLPEQPKVEGELSDEELAEITRQLRVGTIVDFVAAKGSV
jgi:acyl carrier protein